ncbi:hypothetical protein NPIL_258101 [Nephila pilipes]|uniref:Uncharacterized protein n=1 Tax=Nephila pilipes TaxID=299642 RepID=A0A8X6QN30_NEPPI|nr:hypothetical protein NPIL_291391 [Nephila pilipes]GFU22291.1 hypothetical protein NPIL_258101 [Nephila pilipes]
MSSAKARIFFLSSSPCIRRRTWSMAISKRIPLIGQPCLIPFLRGIGGVLPSRPRTEVLESLYMSWQSDIKSISAPIALSELHRMECGMEPKALEMSIQQAKESLFSL